MSTPPIPAALIEILRQARHIAVLTGAGISAESGIPTFRAALTGLWSQYRPEELATPAAFRANPALVWQWYSGLRATMRAAQPNPAHYALAAMQRHAPKVTLLTQNIDGLHQRAGSPDVVELHGNIHHMKCSAEHEPVEAWAEGSEEPPPCPRCGAHIRPDIVWFGERLPDAALDRANEAVRTCDVFFSIGTSGEVEPAASFAPRAMGHGATVVVINLDVTTSEARWLYRFHAQAGQLLPELVRAAWPEAAA
ncbi:NAD-dependent deacylase [Chloroflexia bacterium SDU3-3]|nr:NAD-dependent deacylase [Chloroflexia bacterium SDU3-3]